MAETTPLLRVRRGDLTEGSNPSLSATTSQTPKIRCLNEKKPLSATKKDTFKKNKDTLNLYRINNYYYFRKRINKKLYRLSLKTTDFKLAIKRVKLLKFMSNEELKNMFELQKKDYKVIFEYETIEELEKVLNYVKEIKQIQQNTQEYSQELEHSKKHHSNEFKRYKPLDFETLEKEFLAYTLKINKVKKSSYKQYNSSFSKLKQFFKSKDINELDYRDFEDFRDQLMRQELENKTINNIISYTNNYLEFALNRQLIRHNHVKALKNLKEEKKMKENYTDEEIKYILHSIENEEEHIQVIFKTAIFTGMRISEIISIDENNLKIDEKTNIKYIDLSYSKTNDGIRKIPLHPFLRDLDFSSIYHLDEELDKNRIDKQALRVLYKIINRDLNKKTFHTFRATVIQKLVNEHPDKIELVQEIVGHSKGSKSITLDTYSKEFYLEHKFNVIKTLSY